MKEQFLKIWNSFKEKLGYLKKADVKIKDARAVQDDMRARLAQVPSVYAWKAKAQTLYDTNERELKALEIELSAKQKSAASTLQKFRDAWNKVVGGLLKGTEGLGVAPLVVLGVVAGLIASIALFWNKTVNDTRRINQRQKEIEMVAAGQLPPSALQQEGDKGGIIGQVSGAVLLLGLLFVLPSLMKAGRGGK